MTVDFNDYFWGEKSNGFDVLYHNMKFGLVASKELSEFLREKSTIEEQNSKLMSKLAHKASTGTLNSTFAPIWTILRTSAEKLSTLHLQMVQKLTELVKDVAKYADELHKKHKNVKEEETQTLECVQAMQASTVAVQKQRDLFTSKVQELEKLRKDSGSQKDIEKLETKLRKLQDEYKVLLDKHQPIKNDFEKRMTNSCKRFQEIEEMHLRQMKEFLSTYLELLQTNHDMVGQVHSDFKRQFLDMTVDKLLEQFVLNKYTGLEKPEVPELEFITLSSQQQQQQPHSSRTSSATRLNQTSVSASGGGNTSNSNSATSIQGAILRISSDQRGSAADAPLTVSDAGSTKSLGIVGGAGSICDEVNSESAPNFSRPTSPGFSSTHNETVAPSSSSSNTVSTVKSNFLNWFSSSAPNKTQTQPNAQNYSSSIATSTTEETILDKATSSGHVAVSATPTTHSGNFDYSTSTTSNTAAGIKELRDNVSTSLSERCESSNNTPTTYSRRTTSLLNIFSSNSQVSGILRSRRDKAKSKKSKKKKDGEASDNIQEERFASVERENSTLEHGDLMNKVKSQSIGSKGTSSGVVPSSFTSSLGASDTSVLASAGDNNLTGESTGDNPIVAVGNTSVGSGKKSEKNSTNAVIGYGSIEVDEDGYSKQPPKEIAWEQNKDNVGSFYSDSDTDTDNDNEKTERRIHVKIKPLNNGQAPMSASVDELRATVENISLSPTGVFSHSQQLQQSRVVSRQQSPEISNASTPTATVHPYAPLQSPTLSMSNNSRYADLGDIFSELNDISSSAPSSATVTKAANTNRQVPTPTSTGSIAIPRPPSRRSEIIATSAGLSIAGGRGRASPLPMNRADSIGSLEFRTAIGGIGSSRGPSPLTIGISDTIPLAVAFHEIIHAFFRGADESRCQVKITGDMMLSFPAGIAGLLANNPSPSKLGFRIKNVQNLEHFVPNGKLVQIDKSQSNALTTILEFNMPALTALLRRQAEHNPTASYFNVDILKYQVRSKPGASSCPFQLVSYWKCDPTFTALKIDYKYNNHAMANASPLLNVTLSVPVNGSVRNVQSKPHSAWLGESNRLVWNFTDISQNSQDGGVGTLRARLELNEGPSSPAILSTQFNCEGTTLSGIEFELQGSGYRLSLVKRRFVSGKYVCEGDGIRSGATPTPPAAGSSSPLANC